MKSLLLSLSLGLGLLTVAAGFGSTALLGMPIAAGFAVGTVFISMELSLRDNDRRACDQLVGQILKDSNGGHA